MAERRFAAIVATALDRFVDEGVAVDVAAPPRTSSDLRRTPSERIGRAVVADVDQDLSRHTAGEIQRRLCDA